MAFPRRLGRLFFLTSIAFGVIWLRTLQLQVVEGDQWAEAARKKREREFPIAAPRGPIIDIEGVVLATDRPVYQLAVVGWEWERRARVRCTACGAIHFYRPNGTPRKTCRCGDPEARLVPLPLPDLGPLEDLLELETGRLAECARERLDDVQKLVAKRVEALEARGEEEFLIADEEKQRRNDFLHRPVVIVPRIPEAAVRLVELDTDGTYRGFRVRTDLRRVHPDQRVPGQLLGWTAVVESSKELKRLRTLYGDNVTLDTRIGRHGLEMGLEDLLLGHAGWERQARDTDGAFTIRVDGRPPQRGKTVRLALSARACSAAEEALLEWDHPHQYFPGTRASAGFVAMYADTGAIAAWAETPRFDVEKDLARIFDAADLQAIYNPDIGQWLLPEGVDPPRGETVESWVQRLTKPAPLHRSRIAHIAVEPGSTFKVFIGLAMLASLSEVGPGALLPHETWYACGGPTSKPRCHPHRRVGFEGSIEVSCNPYFAYSVRGQPRYWNVFRRTFPPFLGGLGFGRSTGSDIAGEVEGSFLQDWFDFDPMDGVTAAVEEVSTRRGLPRGAITIRQHGRVPSTLAGRGPKRLQGALVPTLDAALDVAGAQGHVVLNVKAAGGEERWKDLTFQIHARPPRGAPPPRAPTGDPLKDLKQAVRNVGGTLEMDVHAPGTFTFAFTLRYHDPIGVAEGEDPVVLHDEGMNLAIGQGPIAVTPLQMLRGIAALSNGGWLVTPHAAIEADGMPLQTKRTEAGLDPTHIQRVRTGMRAVVVGAQGTARKEHWWRVPATVYGKTGTAQVGSWWRLGRGRAPNGGPWHHWFVGFAEMPGQRPLAFACVLHSRMEGAASATAVKVSHTFLEWWYREGPGAR